MTESIKRLALFFVTSAVFGLVVTGCGTVKGFGRDVEKTGNKIERAANG